MTDYWEGRYASGGHSGEGSRGEAGQRKADYVNALIRREAIRSVVDWGCGEGQQLELLELPDYLGVDVSPTAIARCMERFDGSFLLLDPATEIDIVPRAELALSMDVLFHLVDDADYISYLRRLFASALRFVCIHSTDHEDAPVGHMRRRQFTPYVEAAFTNWVLTERASDPAEAGFYLYRRNT